MKWTRTTPTGHACPEYRSTPAGYKIVKGDSTGSGPAYALLRGSSLRGSRPTFKEIKQLAEQDAARAPKTHFIVQCARASMPASCYGVYRRVAVLEVDEGWSWVSMISERARGCRRVVRTWERLHASGVDTAYSRAMAKAEALADRLNGKEEGEQIYVGE